MNPLSIGGVLVNDSSAEAILCFRWGAAANGGARELLYRPKYAGLLAGDYQY